MGALRDLNRRNTVRHVSHLIEFVNTSVKIVRFSQSNETGTSRIVGSLSPGPHGQQASRQPGRLPSPQIPAANRVPGVQSGSARRAADLARPLPQTRVEPPARASGGAIALRGLRKPRCQAGSGFRKSGLAERVPQFIKIVRFFISCQQCLDDRQAGLVVA